MMTPLKLSPALKLGLTLAIASILAVAQPFLTASHRTLTFAPAMVRTPASVTSLSQVRGTLASAWTDRASDRVALFPAAAQTNNPIQDAIGCTCPICTGIQEK